MKIDEAIQIIGEAMFRQEEIGNETDDNCQVPVFVLRHLLELYKSKEHFELGELLQATMTTAQFAADEIEKYEKGRRV